MFTYILSRKKVSWNWKNIHAEKIHIHKILNMYMSVYKKRNKNFSMSPDT